MNLFFIFKLGVVLIAIATNAFLSYLVYRNNPKSATNRIYTTLGLVINLWLIANFTSVIPAFLDQSLWLIRLSLFFATLMSALFYLFASVFPKREYTLSRKRYVFVGVLTFSVAAITLTPLVFSKVDIVNNSPHPVPGPGIGLFTLVTTLFSILAVVTLFKKYHRSKSVEKQQFSYTLLAISILLGLLIITVLLPVIIFKVNATVSLIPLYTVVFLALTTYAIIRHHLFDIRAVIAKSVTYVLLLITLTSVYGVFAFQIGNLVFDTSKISRTQKILNVVLALVVGFSLQPLKRFFEKFTDNIFYKDKYDPQLLLNDVSHVLASEIDMEKLTTKVSSLIKIQMKVSRANIVVIEDKEVIFGGQAFPSLKPSDYQEILQLGKTHIFADYDDEGPIKHFMSQNGISASIPLHTRDEFVGYFVLGEKLNGEAYNRDDQQVLIILAAELAVAISNAKAYLEIQQFNVTLQDKVNAATKELRHANEKLKALDETKDEFISMASHQLRTPLTSSKGYVSMVLEGDAGKITKMQKELLSQAFFSSQRMVYLIADLLNVSRLRTGKFVIENKPTQLADVIDSELDQLTETAKSRNLTLTYDKPKKFPILMLDETKIRQVIMNFVDNAIYYTPSGGSITVSLTESPEAVELRVTDTGLGVPKADQHHLFTKFYRANNARRARPDGTGLGLFMAKKVVVAQGGAIIFESTEGKGSTFGFSFPKAKLLPTAPVKKVEPTSVSVN